MTSDDQGSDVDRRRQLSSFSASACPPLARTARATRTPTPLSSCEESAHYPVFNPRDPRHNPAAHASWVGVEYYPSESPGSSGSIGWMQSLPGRSLRKARSGLLALRSGMHRRPISLGSRHNGDIGSFPLSGDSTDQKENFFPSTISEASTEEDCEFGTNLYRTSCNCSSSQSSDQGMTFLNVPFSIAMSDNSPFSGYVEEPCGPPGLVCMKSVSSTCSRAESGISSSPSKDRRTTTTKKAQQQGIHNKEPKLPLGSSDQSTVIRDISGETEAADSSLGNTYDSNSSGAAGLIQHRSVQSIPSKSTDSAPPRVPDIKTKSHCTTGKDMACTYFHEHVDPQIYNIDMMLEPETSGPTPQNNAYTESTGLGNVPNMQGEQLHDSQRTHSNGLENISLEGQNGDWGANLLPTPSGNDIADFSDFFGDQAAWSNRPSEEGSTTDITSVSNARWVPIETPGLTSLLPMGDEYFLVDGKSGDFHPDRGGNPIKAERRLISDGSLYSGPGLDRNLSAQTQDIPEVIGPGRPLHQQSSLPHLAEREASDSTDEYLVTYPLFQRRYPS